MRWMVWALLLAGCTDREQRALGTLEWDRVNGRAVASEVIVELMAAEGDQVVKGQPLVRLDDSLQIARLDQLNAAVEKARWNLTELEAGYRSEEVNAARAKYDASVQVRKTRRLEYDRTRRLRGKDFTSEQRLDQATLAYQTALADEEVALQNWQELSSGFRDEDIEQAKAGLNMQLAEKRYQERLLDRYVVVAERAGRLDSLPFKEGDKPPATAVVSTVLAGDAPWARVYVPEKWLHWAHVGVEVPIFVDGREAPYSGRIRFISSDATFTPYYALAEKDRERLTYVAEVDVLGDEASQLPVGTPVQMGQP